MQDNPIDLYQAIKTLAEYPLFSSWSKEAINDLAKLLKKQSYQPEEIIVKQDALIDSIYFIIEGKAEVVRYDAEIRPLTILLPGEAIGLTATGLFSKTSTRTATVIAITNIITLQLDINDLRHILQKYPQLNENLEQASDNILKLHLVKQAAPFAELPIAKLYRLMDKIEEKIIPPGAIVFQQGEIGDSCFLIREGEISITKLLPSGEIKHLATLTAPNIFGETSLLMTAPRNASATAINCCKLLVLPRDVFHELIAEKETSGKLTAIMLERAMPKHNKNVLAFPYITADGEKITILKNPDNKEYFQLNEDGSLVWNLLNANHTIHEILLLLSKDAPHFSVSELKALILDLAKENFVSVEGIRSIEETANLNWWEKTINFTKKILEAYYTFNDIDPWLTKTYNQWVKYLFYKPAKILFAIISLFGFIIFVLFTQKAINLINSQHFSWLILCFIVGLLSIIPHELGHAYATKAYNREVNYFGVGWYWFGPIAFTDTTDTWLCSRNQRIAVDIAGIYVNFVIAGLLSIGILFTSSFEWLWLLAFMSYLLIYLNLDPSLEFDGYYILMDYLDHPNLREDSVVWLLDIFIPALHHPSILKKHYKDDEIIYWVSVVIFIGVRFGLFLLLQTVFLSQIISNKYFWVLPLVLVIISFVSVWVDVRKRQKNMGHSS